MSLASLLRCWDHHGPPRIYRNLTPSNDDDATSTCCSESDSPIDLEQNLPLHSLQFDTMLLEFSADLKRRIPEDDGFLWIVEESTTCEEVRIAQEQWEAEKEEERLRTEQAKSEHIESSEEKNIGSSKYGRELCQEANEGQQGATSVVRKLSKLEAFMEAQSKTFSKDKTREAGTVKTESSRDLDDDEFCSSVSMLSMSDCQSIAASEISLPSVLVSNRAEDYKEAKLCQDEEPEEANSEPKDSLPDLPGRARRDSTLDQFVETRFSIFSKNIDFLAGSSSVFSKNVDFLTREAGAIAAKFGAS